MKNERFDRELFFMDKLYPLYKEYNLFNLTEGVRK